MINGALQILKGLFDTLSDEKWEEINNCPTRSSIAQLSFSRIKEQLEFLAKEGNQLLFFDTVAHVEQIHENLSYLIELIKPFTFEDFPAIYKNLLTFIPQSLKPLTTCANHTSEMTSFTDIFKAVEKSIGKRPRVLY